MINEPHKHIPAFIKAGADLITFHLEAYDFNENQIRDTISLIHELGAKVGLSINPSTDIATVEPFIKDINMVLIMSVNPGFGGQKFIESAYDKISNLKKSSKNMSFKLGTI